MEGASGSSCGPGTTPIRACCGASHRRCRKPWTVPSLVPVWRSPRQTRTAPMPSSASRGRSGHRPSTCSSLSGVRSRPSPSGGIRPSAAAGGNGTYPYFKTIHLITPRTRTPATEAFLTFMRSTDARQILLRLEYWSPAGGGRTHPREPLQVGDGPHHPLGRRHGRGGRGDHPTRRLFRDLYPVSVRRAANRRRVHRRRSLAARRCESRALAVPGALSRPGACQSARRAISGRAGSSGWMGGCILEHADALPKPTLRRRVPPCSMRVFRSPTHQRPKNADPASSRANGGAAALLGFGLGLGVLVILRVLPLRALQRSEEQFSLVAQSAPDGIVLVDGAGRIASWNAGAQTIFGLSEDEAIGRPATELFADSDRARYRELLSEGVRAAVAAGSGPSSAELTGRRRDGAEVPLEVALARWSRGAAVGHTLVIRDISERRWIALRQAQLFEESGAASADRGGAGGGRATPLADARSSSRGYAHRR